MLEIGKFRTDFRNLHPADFAEELRMPFRGFERRQRRLRQLFAGRKRAVLPVEHDPVAGQMLPGELHDLRFGDRFPAGGFICRIRPVDPVQIAVEQPVGAEFVIPQRTGQIEFGMVADRRQEPVGEVAALEFFDFRVEQLQRLFGRVSPVRHRVDDQHAVDVRLAAGAGAGIGDFLRNRQILVEESGRAVGENPGGKLEQVKLPQPRPVEPPDRAAHLMFRRDQGMDALSPERFKRRQPGFRDFPGRQRAEGFLDQPQGGIRIEIAGQHDDHIAGNIVAAVELHHPAGRRILQVFRQADHRTAVRVVREQRGKHQLAEARARPVLIEIELLEIRFQLCVEAAEHRGTEPVELEPDEFFQLVGRQAVEIDGPVEARVGVEAAAAHLVDRLHEFVLNGVLAGLRGAPVDLPVKFLSLVRVPAGLAAVIQLLDLLQQRPFSPVVGRAELFGPFEEQVFQVVSEPGLVGRVVAGTDPEGDAAPDVRRLPVDRKSDGETVVQPVDASLKRVIRQRRPEKRPGSGREPGCENHAQQQGENEFVKHGASLTECFFQHSASEAENQMKTAAFFTQPSGGSGSRRSRTAPSRSRPAAGTVSTPHRNRPRGRGSPG